MQQFKKIRNIHFIGIGGSGMIGIATILHKKGYNISGSDISKTKDLDELAKSGVDVTYTHKSKNIKNKDLIVLSSAIDSSNEEVSFAKKKNIFTAIDNTWGTPYLIKPLDLGFDMSIVSATKYYSGHSDVMGGSLAINKKLFKKVELSQKAIGSRLGPDDAYLIIRGLRTLDIRLDKHQQNALKIAKFFSKQKKVKEVFYPFKKNTNQYKMWKKYYSGASGLMGIKVLSKNKNSVIKFLNKLKLFSYGYSWGGFESLALYQDKLALGNRSYTKLNNNEHIIRLHIGLEDPNDLIADIKQAIKSIR